MARHTVDMLIKNSGNNVQEDFIKGYLAYMTFNKEIIQKLGKKTHTEWHMEIGETQRIPYDESMEIGKYTDIIFESNEFKNDGWCYISLDEASLTEEEQDNEVLYKKWIQNSLENVQVYFSSTLRLDSNFSSINFNISEEKDNDIFLWLVKRIFEISSNDIHAFKVTQTSGKKELHCIFPDRREISWMQLIKAELLAEDVPSAYAVWYMPNIGSVVISTQEVFSNESKQHRDTAHAIEQELHKIGLLPLIKGSGDLGFIGREEWLKNMGITD